MSVDIISDEKLRTIGMQKLYYSYGRVLKLPLGSRKGLLKKLLFYYFFTFHEGS
jgi:hypothetical protein